MTKFIPFSVFSFREQTLDQLALHEALLEEITCYQTNLEDVKGKGRTQIDRYVAAQPNVQVMIEKQLQNVQDSYDSLLHTGLQIKKRLIESLSKFQEYEDALESIMENLDEWEPEIDEQLAAPIENVEASSQRLEYIRVRKLANFEYFFKINSIFCYPCSQLIIDFKERKIDSVLRCRLVKQQQRRCLVQHLHWINQSFNQFQIKKLLYEEDWKILSIRFDNLEISCFFCMCFFCS
jgi:hypothetical protein